MQAVLMPVGIAAALVIAGAVRRLATRRAGVAAGWTIGALVGFPVGGIVFLAALGNRYHPGSILYLGSVGGLIAGAVVGPIIGAMALVRKGDPGDQLNRGANGSYWITQLLPFVVFAAGILALVYLQHN